MTDNILPLSTNKSTAQILGMMIFMSIDKLELYEPLFKNVDDTLKNKILNDIDYYKTNDVHLTRAIHHQLPIDVLKFLGTPENLNLKYGYNKLTPIHTIISSKKYLHADVEDLNYFVTDSNVDLKLIIMAIKKGYVKYEFLANLISKLNSKELNFIHTKPHLLHALLLNGCQDVETLKLFASPQNIKKRNLNQTALEVATYVRIDNPEILALVTPAPIYQIALLRDDEMVKVFDLDV